MKRLNLDVDDGLHAKFKAYCARKGVDMREEVVELLSLVLEAKADQPREEEIEPYSSENVETEGEGEESPWKDIFKPSTPRESASPPFLREKTEGEISGDVDERFRKIEADTKALWERVRSLLNYINERTKNIKELTEKVSELTETVGHIEKFLKGELCH